MAIKTICTILARGGSKGVPNKNTRLLLGTPLIHYTLNQAIKSNLFDVIVVSSDSDKILEIASEIKNIELVKRPAELANDVISKRPAIKHAVNMMEEKYNTMFDNVIDLDCTSPLRHVEDINNSFNQFKENNNDNLISAMPARRSPYFNMVKTNPTNNQVSLVIQPDIPVTCRQDAPECFDMNASIYIWRREVLYNTESNYLKNTGLYIMPEERSIDVDNEIDFNFVEFIMKKNNA